MTSDDILRSYEVKRSVCARNWTLFYNIITCNPERQANGSVCERFILLNRFVLVNQFTKSDWSVWNILHLEQHRSTSYSKLTFRHLTVNLTQNHPKYWCIWSCDEWIIQSSSSSNSHWTEQTVRLGPKTDEPLIWACVNPTLNRGEKLKILWFLVVF